MFKIEKNVPLPERKIAEGKTKYPLADMEPGYSFFIPCQDHEASRVQSNASALCAEYTKRKKLTQGFTTRRVEGGVRVWRLGVSSRFDRTPAPVPTKELPPWVWENSRRKYNFDGLAIGQYFIVKCEKHDANRLRNSVQVSRRNHQLIDGNERKNFDISIVRDGIRVERVADASGTRARHYNYGIAAE